MSEAATARVERPHPLASGGGDTPVRVTRVTRLPSADDTPATRHPRPTRTRCGSSTTRAVIVLCAPNKHPIAERWQSDQPDLDAVLSHAVKGGLVGIIPASVDATVIDVDEGGDQAATELVAALGEPVLQNATQRAGGAHFWYRSPGGEGGNMKWKYGDVRSARGFAVLWDANALAAAVVTDRFTDAEPVDLDALPAREAKGGSDVERMAQAAPGERNDLLNRLAFSWAKRGETMAPLRAAAIAAGLSRSEVSATIRSAATAGANGKAKGKAKGLDPEQRRPTKDARGAPEVSMLMTHTLQPATMWVPERGWFVRESELSLWRHADSTVVAARCRAHPRVVVGSARNPYIRDHRRTA